MQESLTRKIGEFIHRCYYDDLPEEVVQRSKICLLYSLGIGLAGHRLDFPEIAGRSMRKIFTPSDLGSTLFVHGYRLAPPFAAFANAVLLHSRAQEDTLHATRTHMGPVIIPATLALAEAEKKGGKDVLTALVAGYETAGAVSRGNPLAAVDRGFRATSCFAIFGSAAASGKLLGLGPDQLTNALAYAASFAMGITQCFVEGTMEWRFQAGQASQSGMLAAFLAREGAIGSVQSLEGPKGFYSAFCGGASPIQEIEELGIRYQILDVIFKPYPVGGINQTMAEAMVSLRQNKAFSPQRVKAIRVAMNDREAAYPGILHRGPFHAIGSTTMSAPFCMAGACIYGTLNLDILQRFQDTEILNMIERISIVPTDKVPPLSCRVRMVLDDGQELAADLFFNEKDYQYDWDTAVRRLSDLQPEMAISRAQWEDLVSIVCSLEDQPDMIPLIHCTIAH